MNTEPYSRISNILFLIPAILLLQTQDYWGVILACLVATLSVTFHIVKQNGAFWWHDLKNRHWLETALLSLDTLAAVSLVAYMLVRYVIGQPLVFTDIIAMTLLIIGFVLMCLPCKSHKQYDIRHGSWHLLSAAATTLALLG